MRARFERVIPRPGQSFYVQERQVRRFEAPWHFHQEVELTLIVAGRGRRFVGDSIESFREGDLVLLGPNLPHFWHTEGPQNGAGTSHSVVLQFRENFLGAEFLLRPELVPVRRLLKRAVRGLHFAEAGAAAEALKRLGRERGLAALRQLLAILEELAEAAARPLASQSYDPEVSRRAERRLARVYSYLADRFRDDLSLPEVARVAAMTPPAFSRYFRRSTGRTFSGFVSQLRIDYAARELVDSDRRVADIAFNAGFPTLSNFNRWFLRLKGITPRDYRAAFWNVREESA